MARGRRRDRHVLDEHVNVPEVSSSGQARPLVLRHEVGECQTVQAGLLPVAVERVRLTGGEAAPDVTVVSLLTLLSSEPLQVADIFLQRLQLRLQGLPVGEGCWRSADGAREQTGDSVLGLQFWLEKYFCFIKFSLPRQESLGEESS